jgi:hypothetical protein
VEIINIKGKYYTSNKASRLGGTLLWRI